MLLGLWIYWYVSNYIIFKHVGEKLSPQIIYDGTNVAALVGGIILLVAISFIMSLTFRHLNVQLKLTNLYDNFIANITHELKSPLSSIQLYLETLDEREVPRQKEKEFLGMMMKDADRLKNLIDSILEVSAFEQKKIVHDYEVYGADKIFRKLLKEASEEFNLSEDSLTIGGEAQCSCVLDADAIKIIINNLIDNAIKYTVKPLKMNAMMKCSANKFIFEFSDNGIGIPASELKRIFNKFHRIYGQDIPNVKGTGLGLYRVKEIIKAHGGKITALSEGNGKGSKFRIELPVYQKLKKRFVNKLLKKSAAKRKQREEPYESQN